MIARIAYSEPASDEVVAKRLENLQNRFKPAITQQPGLVAGFWVTSPDGRRGSITIWESQELMLEAGRAANAVPLLPGYEPDDLSGPDNGQTVQILDVFDHHIGPGRTVVP